MPAGFFPLVVPVARSTPSCATHHVAFAVDKNGVMVIETDSAGDDYQLQWGDRYRCPVGGELIVVGFGDAMYADEDQFARWVFQSADTGAVEAYREARL